MRLKSIISAVAALAIVFAATSCGKQGNDTKADNYLKTTTVYNGAEIDIANEKLRQYIDATTYRITEARMGNKVHITAKIAD